MEAKNRPTEKLDALVKARIRPKHKRALQRIARRREIDLSDVLREAFRMYLDHARQNTPEKRAPELVNAA